MNTRRMDTILAIAIIMAVLPVCTQAIPMPHSVAGTVYLSDGVTQAPVGTSYNVTTSEDCKEGTTGGPNSGMYVKSINGEDGDPVTVYAWNATHHGANTTTLSSDAITTMDVIIDTPFADNSPSATILHPNGGESIPIGTQVQVSAHATDDTAVTSVTFSYSNNSGSNWNPIGAGAIVSGTDKDGIWNGTWNTNNLGAGSNYLIRAVASDGTSPGEDQSDSTFSLTCTPPPAPTLNDPGTTDTDGSYTVSWSSVSGATNYTLEEDTSGSFGSPIVVYSGSGTSTQITGRSNGTYYYRVKACNACGCGGWSNVEDIDVDIPSGNIITVDDSGGADYATIQEAVDNAGGGYTIKVFSGTYNEHVVIDKSLKLIGEDKNTTIVDGSGSGDVVNITADCCTITRFTVTGSGSGSIWNPEAGIKINSNDSTVSDNIISNNYYGIILGWTFPSSNNVIINNNVNSNNVCGIALFSSSNNTIIKNNANSNCEVGIDLWRSSNNNVVSNNVSDNYAGIILGFSSNNNLTANTVDSNDWMGIRLHGSYNNLISNSLSSNNHYGISLGYGSSDNLIYHNNLINNTQNAEDEVSTNSWDNGYPSGGNYWSGHPCTGNPSDGSQPYTISGGDSAVDHYPFEDMNGWLTIQQKGDLNGDNQITPADAAIALQIAASGGWDPAADVNRDSRITSLDALTILQAAGEAIELQS